VCVYGQQKTPALPLPEKVQAWIFRGIQGKYISLANTSSQHPKQYKTALALKVAIPLKSKWLFEVIRVSQDYMGYSEFPDCRFNVCP
jgi:hypothetical protein